MKPHSFRLAAAPLLALALTVGLSNNAARANPDALMAGVSNHEPRATVLASSSPAFDEACANYYSQGNDVEVMSDQGVPESFCECLAERYAAEGLGTDALDFYARTYSDDLTTFIHEYPEGDAWMEGSFQADTICKTG
ncbi:MAG: hypothetical protein H0T56_07475 [Pseudaminobacter sp.]|nr:hypothetical protein [Pseudaminobacter sp.]